MDKEKLIFKLYEEYKSKFNDKKIVLGEGNLQTKLILIGEAPGKDEIKLSRPFVGMAGKNLNEFLSILNIERKDIYITNVIKYRLSKINSKSGRIVNRPATKVEIEQNKGYLLREINIVNPKYIVTLGNVPLRAVTGDNNITIGEVHGNLQKITFENHEYGLFPLYHPASIIYNRSLKDTYVSDIKQLKSINK